MRLFSWLKKKKKDEAAPYCVAIIAAAGSGSRMGGGGKLLLPVNGEPVIVHTLRALNSCEGINEIIIAARNEDLLTIADIAKDYGFEKVKKVITGGETRVKSVLAALMELPEKAELVAIHDGARCCVTPELCTEVISLAAKTKAAAPVIPLSDTIKQVRQDGTVERTIDRSLLRAVQTPQVFDLSLIKAALVKAETNGLEITDDCSAVETMGVTVHTVMGDMRNIKITTNADLQIAEAYLSENKYL